MAYRANESQRGSNRDRIRFDLIECVGVLSTKESGWRKEANIISWNGGDEKLDIREWDPKHQRMSKGITLFADEAEALAIALADRYGLRERPRFAARMAPPRGGQPQAGQRPYGGEQSQAGPGSHSGGQMKDTQNMYEERSPFEVQQLSGSAAEDAFEGSVQQGETRQEDDIPFEGRPEHADNSMLQDSLQPVFGNEAMAVAETVESEAADLGEVEGEAELSGSFEESRD